jgi:uncharacterized protein YeaO (DUF488 family)
MILLQKRTENALVDKLWPRVLKKEEAMLDGWLRSLAPSDELRKKFHQDGDFRAFEQLYRKEIDPCTEDFRQLLKNAKKQTVTLCFASKNESENNARVLKDVLEEVC